MGDREKLARVIFCNVSGVREEYPPIVRAVIWEAAYQTLASGQTMLSDWPHDAADKILASDWLRDTLAAERERAAHRACVAYQHGTNGTDEWDYFAAAANAIDAAIRNLAPRETIL